MATVLDPRTTPEQAVTAATPAMQRWGVSVGQFAIVGGFCLLFLYHNYLPLFHSDLWGHVAYGRWMLEHGSLPTVDPFVELAEGVPLTATAWLSQVSLALLDRVVPVEGLAHGFALATMATYLLLGAAFRRRGGQSLGAVLGLLAVFALSFSRHAVQRPETFGLVAFAGVLWLIASIDTARRRSWPRIIALGVVLALWANLHGSFVVGLLVVGLWWLGCVVDLLLEGQGVMRVLIDRTFWTRLFCLEACLIGACLNPYGPDLILQAFAFPTHPNLDSVLEWHPLQMRSLEGIPMGISWLATVFVLRWSRRPMTSAEVLWLVVFNLATCLRVRMIAWYGPVFVFTLLPHAVDVARQLLSRTKERVAVLPPGWSQPSVRWLALSVFLVWITFALSPISRPVLGGKPRRSDQVFSHQTPLKLTRYLQQHPPQGLVFAPQWWSDWLMHAGPAGLRVMTSTNTIHLLPSQVWNDYLCIAAAASGWEAALDRYRINTVVASVDLQSDLAVALAQSPEWKVAYEDDLGLVAIRRPVRTESAPTSEATRTAETDPVPLRKATH